MRALTDHLQLKLRSQCPVLWSSNGPLPYNAHHCLNIKAIFRENEGAREFPGVHVHEWLSVPVYLFLHLYAYISACVCISCMSVQPLPHSIQLLFCDGWQTCSEEGEGFLVRKHFFDCRNLWFPFLPEN